MAYKGDDGRTYASKSSFDRAKRLGLTGKPKSSSSSRSSSSSSRSSGSSTSSSSSSGYRAPDGRIYSSQSAYERTQALRRGDDQPRSTSNAVTEIDSQQAAEEQRTRQILAQYGSPAVQQQFEVVRRQPEGTTRPVFIPEDEFDEDRDYGREVITYPTSAEGFSDEEVARQVSSQIPQATQESFDRQVEYRERVEQNIFDYGSDEVKFRSAEAGLLTGDRTPELTFSQGFTGYFSDKPRVAKDVGTGVVASLLLGGLGSTPVVGPATKVVATAAAVKYTVDSVGDIIDTPKQYRGYKAGEFTGEFLALSGGLGGGGLSAKGLAKGSRTFLTKTKIGRGFSDRLGLRNQQPRYLAATDETLSAIELFRPLSGQRRSSSAFILQNPDRVPKNTPGIIIQDSIFTPTRRGGGAGRVDTSTRLFTQAGDPIPQRLQITSSGLQFDPTISSSANVFGSTSGRILRESTQFTPFNPTIRDVRFADTRGNRISGRDFTIQTRGNDFDPRIESGPRKGETFGEITQPGPYREFSFPDYRYSPKGLQIPKLGSRGAITLPVPRSRPRRRVDLDLEFGSVSRTRARSRSRSVGTTVTTPDFSKLIRRPRNRFAATSAYGVANIYGSARRSSFLSATQSSFSLGTRSTGRSITGLRGITSGGTSLGGFGTFNFKGPTGIKLPKLRGSRSRSFSTGRSRSNFKTFSSVTAAAFNIRGSKKQRRRSKFTGLEIIGLQ